MKALNSVYPSVERFPVESIHEYSLKRLVDFLLATIALVVTSPLWLIFIIAVKAEDGGSVFYKQERWGKDKRRITLYKFRTMVENADKEYGSIQASENDPRITRIGKFLRATSLDEMPQLLNIWKGEMSWVGPRALPINEIQIREKNGYLPDEAIPGFDLRMRVRPGLTGVAQVYASKDAPRKHKFKYDLIYVKSQSLWFDVKLILASLWITLCGKWESRSRKLSNPAIFQSFK